jgi:hypothetical protein
MPIEKHKDGKVVCIFGYGDILIAPGNDEGTDSIEAMQITLSKQKAHPIDVQMPELKGKRIEDWVVKIYFNNPKSVDSFIHVLEDYKKERFSECEHPTTTAA